jgi:hypothetical protein
MMHGQKTIKLETTFHTHTKKANFQRYVYFVDSNLEDKEIMRRTGATSLEQGGRNGGKGSSALHQDMNFS